MNPFKEQVYTRSAQAAAGNGHRGELFVPRLPALFDGRAVATAVVVDYKKIVSDRRV